MEHLKDLTLQLLLILMPSFLYFVFWRERVDASRKRNGLLGALLLAVTMVLCMSFPVRIAESYVADLRFILLIVGFLYGGLPIGFTTAGVMVICRYLASSHGYEFLLYGLPLHLVPLLLVRRRFWRFSSRTRKFVCVGLSFWAGLVGYLIFLFQLKIHYLDPAVYDKVGFFWSYTLMYVIGMFVVVTVTEAFIENTRLRTELQRHERLSVLGELAASIAHEVRNPLTASSGFLQLLTRTDVTEKKQKQYLDAALDGLRQAEAILKDYLTFAKPQIRQKSTLQVAACLEDALKVTASYAAMRNVELQPDLQADVCVEGERQKFGQTLINLIKNAIEASQPGDTVYITTQQRKERVLIEVRDQGAGMSEVEVGRLGNPFYTTKTEGTGLGLMVSYRIIEAMGGRIEVDSREGAGSRFTISLPIRGEK
ncbi:MAG TPA: ATP-binding protein [Bacilli bacterium]|nr:ATP-binding protein [Bacilli bacterium]